MSKWGCAAVAVLALAAMACIPGVGGTRQVTHADLRAMALRVTDLPPGFRPVEEQFTSNDGVANHFAEPGEVRSLLESWGRVTGFMNVFVTTVDDDHLGHSVMISSSVDSYRDAEHAREAWDGQEGLLRYSIVPIEQTVSFEAPLLGDQSAALRLSLGEKDGEVLVMYWIYMRLGTVVADVSTVTTPDLDDGGKEVVHLARRLHARVSSRLQ